MSFVVVRHPEAGVGTAPVGALEYLAANGWECVSDERPTPADFHLPDFAEPAVAEPEKPVRPAAPEKDQEEQS